MFHRIGRLTYRWRWQVVLLWGVLLLVTLPLVPKLDDPLKVGGFTSPDTESSRARVVLEEELGLAPSTLIIVFASETLHAEDDRFLDQVEAAVEPLRVEPSVTNILLPTENSAFIAPNGEIAYAAVGLDEPPEVAQRNVGTLTNRIAPQPDLTFLVAGGPASYADIEKVSQQDLRRAEFIAFPFAMAALLFVFGSVVAAFVPLIVGGTGVAAVLLTLYILGNLMDLSIFVLNLATMLGLGLAVDYSLFVTSRFREELGRNGGDVAVSIERTMALAGRAVFFSGFTVFIGLSGLTLFSFMFLRSVGIAGVAVVFFATLSALTLLPAVLSIIGTRIDRGRLLAGSLGRGDEASNRATGFWAGLSRRVMARPFLVLIPTLIFLVVLGAPFTGIKISSPDGTILPESTTSRQGFDLLVDNFGAGEVTPIVIAVRSPDSIFATDGLGDLYDLTVRLQNDPRIARVDSLMSYDQPVSRGQAIALAGIRRGAEGFGVDTRVDSLAAGQVGVILAYPRGLANDDANKVLLREIRGVVPQGGSELLVTGSTAEIVDVVARMYGDVPRAALLIVGATYLVLLVLLRSVLLPIKAILMNTLSILASFGALVWIFQDGHFSGVLNFTPLGFVEASLPVIMFCILFGLSMDYEIFLLSRIREEWDRTNDNTLSVAVGLQRSGRIITSAALIVVVVTASFVTADVILVKALGLGIALAVLLDATIVRALLVPATMRLLGRWNWWLPGWLARLIPHHSLVEE